MALTASLYKNFKSLNCLLYTPITCFRFNGCLSSPNHFRVTSITRPVARFRSTTISQGINIEVSNNDALKDVESGFSLIENFVSDKEEEKLFKEVNRYLRKLRYEFDHWDNAICGFRETEKVNWEDCNKKIIDRLRDYAFDAEASHLLHVHVLDLDKDGYIKPHVDSVRFCGSTIAGISLLSPCIMKLIHTEDSSRQALCHVKRRSLYIMKDVIRYNYTHEVLKNNDSFFKGEPINKDRRISIICRNEPVK